MSFPIIARSMLLRILIFSIADIHKSDRTTHTTPEVVNMAKQGMKRPDITHTQPKDTAAAEYPDHVFILTDSCISP